MWLAEGTPWRSSIQKQYGPKQTADQKSVALQKTALVFTVIGAINWGLIGLFNFNLVDSLFGQNSFLSMLIYIVVGIAGLINIMLFFTDLNIKE